MSRLPDLATDLVPLTVLLSLLLLTSDASSPTAVAGNLTANLQSAWQKAAGLGELNAENIKEPLRDIRRALLEADVSLPVVRRFVKRVEERALGTEVVKGVRPDQQLVKVVADELTNLMGGKQAPLATAKSGPVVILMAGLQGVGKTTACGKLATYLRRRQQKVLLVGTDVYRPAAIDQLQTLGKQVGMPVFDKGTDADPVEVALEGVAKGKAEGFDAVIIDTAGRLQVDPKLMAELESIKRETQAEETLLVVDAMTGQEAANLVDIFNQQIGITGALLTKLDGDSRGGAALSIREVSGRPIKFVGIGERMEDLDAFVPERMTSRILGMGDVLTLVEKAEEAVSEEEARRIQEKLMNANFDFNDFQSQMAMMERMGAFSNVMAMLPGGNKMTPKQQRDAQKSMKNFGAMIDVMTDEEKSTPDLLMPDGEDPADAEARRTRIAEESEQEVEQVDLMVAQFQSMRLQMANLGKLMKGDIPMETAPPIPKGHARRRRPKGAAPKPLASMAVAAAAPEPISTEEKEAGVEVEVL